MAGDAQHTVAQVFDAMDAIAPPEYAESWDRHGLQIGSRADALRGPVVLAIDLTDDVLAEALASGSNTLIAYHPPMFHPLKSLTDEQPLQGTLLRAAREGLNVYSPHTALDAAHGGLNDWLANGIAGSDPQGELRGGDIRAISPWAADRALLKIVTFVPVDAAQRVRDALATAGAGRIGAYTDCSFSTQGVGTFFGGEGASPAVGSAGRLEEVSEVRLEMVCPSRAAAIAIETLREFHPYEEPAVDLVPLAPVPERQVGPGRRIVLDRPATAGTIAQRMKAYLGIDAVKLACVDADQEISVVGVCAGAGAELAEPAADNGCEMYVTGEMRHHEALQLRRRGVSVLLCGHTNTERPYLPVLARRLSEKRPGVEFRVSGRDRSPFTVV